MKAGTPPAAGSAAQPGLAGSPDDRFPDEPGTDLPEHPALPEGQIVCGTDGQAKTTGLTAWANFCVPLELKTLFFHQHLCILRMNATVDFNAAILTDPVSERMGVGEGHALVQVGRGVIRYHRLNSPAVRPLSVTGVEHMPSQFLLEVHNRLQHRLSGLAESPGKAINRDERNPSSS